MDIQKIASDEIKRIFESKEFENDLRVQIQKTITGCVNRQFEYYGPLYKIMESKLSEILVPMIEEYNFKSLVPKLDKVLTDVINNSACADYKKICHNFKSFMTDEKIEKIKLSEIFEKYCEYCSDDVDTAKLEINNGNGEYYNINCYMKTENLEYCYKKVVFNCEEDEDLHKEIYLSDGYFSKKEYTIRNEININLKSLRYEDKFNIFIMQLKQWGTKIIMDIENDENDVEVADKPELSYN